MWLSIVFILVIVAAVAGMFAGGIFTIVLIPIAGIALVAALAYTLLSRAAQPTPEVSESDPPPPHRLPRDSGHAPTSPERLADARRVQQ